MGALLRGGTVQGWAYACMKVFANRDVCPRVVFHAMQRVRPPSASTKTCFAGMHRLAQGGKTFLKGIGRLVKGETRGGGPTHA